MIENISRYIEMGEKPLEAALKGAEQTGFTDHFADHFSDRRAYPVVVYGRYRWTPLPRPFAVVTLSVTILMSAVVSLTLTPMMSARLLKHTPEAEQSRFYKASEKAFDSVVAFYGRTLLNSFCATRPSPFWSP